MSLGPLDVTSIIERLADQVSALKIVGGAADRAAADESTLAMPAAFVILAAEEITTTPTSGLYIHQARARIDVLYAVRHYQGGKRGQRHAEDGIPIVRAGRKALNNWTPVAPPGAVIESMRGTGKAGLLALKQQEWWWVDPFEVIYRGRA